MRHFDSTTDLALGARRDVTSRHIDARAKLRSGYHLHIHHATGAAYWQKPGYAAREGMPYEVAVDYARANAEAFGDQLHHTYA